MSMSVDNFKTSIYEYLETLPTITFMRLFEKPATCLAIFRLEYLREREKKKESVAEHVRLVDYYQMLEDI